MSNNNTLNLKTDGMRISSFTRRVFVRDGEKLLKAGNELLNSLKPHTKCHVEISYDEAKQLKGDSNKNWAVYFMDPDAPPRTTLMKKVEKVEKPGKYTVEVDVQTADLLSKAPVMIRDETEFL